LAIVSGKSIDANLASPPDEAATTAATKLHPNLPSPIGARRSNADVFSRLAAGKLPRVSHDT
jgi:hypothetical protein